MGASDWTTCTNSLATSSVARNPTSGTPRPPGAGQYLFAMHSRIVQTGAVGLFVNQVGFAPMPFGGIIHGMLTKLVSGGGTNFGAAFFFSAAGPDVSDVAYILALSEAEPAHLLLKKARQIDGLADEAPNPTVNKILRRSVETFGMGEFVQVRLRVIDQPGGDVVLKVQKNDLTAVGANLTTPTWIDVPGMDPFTDDVTQINTGSAPLVGGRAGKSGFFRDVNRRVAFDQVVVEKQNAL